MKRKILIVSLFVLPCILLAIFLFPSRSNHGSAEISAESLWSEFNSDLEASKSKYDGLPLTVTGTVSETSESFMGAPCVLIDNGADTIPSGIFCLFDGESPDAISGQSVGTVVSISGTCSVGAVAYGENAPYIFIKNSHFS